MQASQCYGWTHQAHRMLQVRTESCCARLAAHAGQGRCSTQAARRNVTTAASNRLASSTSRIAAVYAETWAPASQTRQREILRQRTAVPQQQAVQQFQQQQQLQQQHSQRITHGWQTAPSGSAAMGSNVPYDTQQQQQQQRRQQQGRRDSSSIWQQPTPQQPGHNNSSSSSYWRRPGSSSSGSSSAAQPNEVLSSAIDKLYQQRLREVKAMLASGSLQELQRGLTPEQQESLQIVLQDLQDMQGSWEEEDEVLSEAEQQLVQQLSSSQVMPDDFSSYLMAMLPAGSGPAELQQLLQSLDPTVLEDIQSVYYDLKAFEQTQMDLEQAQERYVELSSRIASATARVQGTLAAQAAQQQQAQQQPQQQQRRQPLRYSDMAFGRNSSSSSRAPSPAGQGSSSSSGNANIGTPPAAASSRIARSNGSSSSSRAWGSQWGKPHAQPRASRSAAPGTQAAPQQQEQQPTKVASVPQRQTQVQQPEQLQQSQQADNLSDRTAPAAGVQEQQQSSTGATAAAGPQQQQQQQRQQPGVRQRRRRVIIRRDASSQPQQ